MRRLLLTPLTLPTLLVTRRERPSQPAGLPRQR
jgi:hypothetical protein